MTENNEAAERPVGHAAADAGVRSGPGVEQEPAAEGAFRTGEGPQPPPDVPGDVRAAARLAPDHWLALVDPAWQGPGPPPLWALRGRWRSGSTGEVQEWQDNADYLPSPRARGWPEPTDPVDDAIQLATTGYGDPEAVVKALAETEVAVLVHPDGTLVTAASPDSAPVLPVYTSQVHVEAAGRLLYELAPVSELATRLPQHHSFYVNPTGPVSMRVETEPLLRALKAAEERYDQAARAARDQEDATGSPPPDLPPGAPGAPAAAAAGAPGEPSPGASEQSPPVSGAVPRDGGPRETGTGANGPTPGGPTFDAGSTAGPTRAEPTADESAEGVLIAGGAAFDTSGPRATPGRGPARTWEAGSDANGAVPVGVPVHDATVRWVASKAGSPHEENASPSWPAPTAAVVGDEFVV